MKVDEEFPAFYWIWMFIIFIKVCHQTLSWAVKSTLYLSLTSGIFHTMVYNLLNLLVCDLSLLKYRFPERATLFWSCMYLCFGNNFKLQLLINQTGSGLWQIALIRYKARPAKTTRTTQLMHPFGPFWVQPSIRLFILRLKYTHYFLWIYTHIRQFKTE